MIIATIFIFALIIAEVIVILAYQTKKKNIPEKILGYDLNWR